LRTWSSVSDGTTLNYPYGVQVIDFVASGPLPTTAPTPTPFTAFRDGFESGNFAGWTRVATAAGGTATVQSQIRKTGSYAAAFSASAASGAYAYARKSLGTARMALTAEGDFDVTREGASGGNVPFIRLFTSSGTRLLSVYRQNQSSNRIYVSWPGTYALTSGTLPLNTWGRVSLRVIVNGTASTVEVRLNGTLVYRTTSAVLGSTGILTVQIGSDTTSQTFTVTADNISITS
jgi:hypothetical protein